MGKMQRIIRRDGTVAGRGKGQTNHRSMREGREGQMETKKRG